MRHNRREFLKLLGIGGASAAFVGSGSASLSGALFRPDVPLIKGGTADHLVFDQSKAVLKPWARATFLSITEEAMMWKKDGTQFISDRTGELRDRYVQTTGRAVSTISFRNPKPLAYKGDQVDQVMGWNRWNLEPDWERSPNWTTTGPEVTWQTERISTRGRDPHVSFYLAAAELQDRIHADLSMFLAHVEKANQVLVTQVHEPIMAFPTEDSGFILGCAMSMFATSKDGVVRDEAYSETGEFPMLVPGDVEFKYLTLLEDELKIMGLLPETRSDRARKLDEAWRRTRRSEAFRVT